MTASHALAVATPRNASLPDKISYARALAESGLLPAAFRKNPANVLFAVEYGDMLGLSPMAAITGIHVIDGKPSASAALMSALVRRDGHKLRVTYDKETTAAYAELIRADDPDFTYRADWDLDRAEGAELCTIRDGRAYARDSKGRPTSWEKYTPNMLKWRCVAEVCRDGAEECLMGMHYTPEELGAEVDSEGDPVRVTAERVPTEQPHTESSPDWDALITAYEAAGDLTRLGDLWRDAKRLRPDDTDLRERIEQAAKRIPVTVSDNHGVESDPPPFITERQSNRLHAMCTEHGINRDTKLALLSHLTEREITTSADLTVAEAELVNTCITAMTRRGVPLIEQVIELIDRPAPATDTVQHSPTADGGR